MRAIHYMISVAVSAAAHVELYDFRMLEYFWAEESQVDLEAVKTATTTD